MVSPKKIAGRIKLFMRIQLAIVLQEKYPHILEHFSRELIQYVEYTLDENGEMTVSNETIQFYCFQDMTFQSERLFWFIKDTIEDELNPELEYLNIFDQSRIRLREIVDMPDRKLVLLDVFYFSEIVF